MEAINRAMRISALQGLVTALWVAVVVIGAWIHFGALPLLVVGLGCSVWSFTCSVATYALAG